MEDDPITITDPKEAFEFIKLAIKRWLREIATTRDGYIVEIAHINSSELHDILQMVNTVSFAMEKEKDSG